MERQPRHAKASGATLNLMSQPIGGARPRKLKAKWSAQELRDLWGTDLLPAGSRAAEVADVEIQVGVPPLVHSWLLSNSIQYVKYSEKPLQRARFQGRSYYVLPIKHGAIYDIGNMALDARSPVVRASSASEVGAVVAWFESIDPVLYLIKQMDDVVSLTPICAKLVVAPEGKACPWRRRKT